MDQLIALQHPALIERTTSLENAESQIRRAIDGLGLSPQLKDFDPNSDGPTAWSCRLIDKDGIQPALGAGGGKGNRTEGRVGALFEALEHVLTGPTYFDIDDVYLEQASNVATGVLAAEASAAILASTPEQELACCRYSALHSEDQIDVPLYLSSPWYVENLASSVRKAARDRFDYRNVARYSTNSGSAIGLTESEATVHAINEVIERDASSLLLVRSFFGQSPPKLVKPESLPQGLTDLLSYVQGQVGLPVHLLDITTEVDVPAYLAYTSPTADRPYSYGAGASLSPYYAAYRALSEILQSHLPRKLLSTKSFHTELEPLRKYPQLYQCGLFDLTELLPLAEPAEFTDHVIPVGPQVHLAELSERLRIAGFSIYQRKVRTLDNGITVVHVLIPGMERFMGVTVGIPVTPGQRGIRGLKKN